MWNKNEIKLNKTKTNVFFQLTTDHIVLMFYFSFVSAPHTCETKRWKNHCRHGLKQLWNKSKTFFSCFSVLFQLRFTSVDVWNKIKTNLFCFSFISGIISTNVAQNVDLRPMNLGLASAKRCHKRHLWAYFGWCKNQGQKSKPANKSKPVFCILRSHCYNLLLLQGLLVDVAIVTSCHHAALSCANRLADGRRSVSTVLSQVCLGRPVLHLHSTGGPMMQAWTAQ